MREMTRTTLCVLALLAGGVESAKAQPVGKFALVQNEVTSLKPGAPSAIPAAVGAEIVIDELETTGAGSAAKLLFGEGAVISVGQATEFRVTQMAVRQATGASVSTVDLLVGRMRVFVSRFWGGRPEVEVHTPTAVVGIKGSEVVIEVLPDGTTRVIVLSGSAAVRVGGAAIDLAVAERLVVVPGAEAPVSPDKASPEQLDAAWAATEASPGASKSSPPPRAPSTGDPKTLAAAFGGKSGDSAFRVNTTSSVSSADVLMAFPQSVLSSEPLVFDQRDPTGQN